MRSLKEIVVNYKSAIKTVIDLISISVRTAPKSAGVDDIIFLAASDKQKSRIAKKMIDVGRDKAKGKSNRTVSRAIATSWMSDAKTVADSQGLILIAVKGKKTFGANCGCCGFKSCKDFQIHISRDRNSSVLGPFCIFKIWDLGIAIASGAKTASMLNVDNRIMYRIGTAVEKLRIFRGSASKKGGISNRISPILGLPLSISGKNIYFDRLDKLQAAKTLKDYFIKRDK